jgi:hypothetical protein
MPNWCLNNLTIEHEDDDEDDAPFKLVGVPNHPEA